MRTWLAALRVASAFHKPRRDDLWAGDALRRGGISENLTFLSASLFNDIRLAQMPWRLAGKIDTGRNDTGDTIAAGTV